MLVYWRVLSGGPYSKHWPSAPSNNPRSLGFENRLEFNEGIENRKKNEKTRTGNFFGVLNLHGGFLGHELCTCAPLHDPNCIVKCRLSDGFSLLLFWPLGKWSNYCIGRREFDDNWSQYATNVNSKDSCWPRAATTTAMKPVLPQD